MADRALSAETQSFDSESLAAAVGGALLRSGSRPIRGGAVDSRRVEPGNAFFALAGEHTDGHLFLSDAVRRGAAALVISGDVDVSGIDDVAVVRVDETLVALRRAAAAWRDRFSPLVVGVTGSLAKTSTKEQAAEVLSARWQVLRNTANENNEIGLPLTLLRLSPNDEVAVLEMGMYQPGDIKVLADVARPTIGVVTAVRGTHLERAGSIDAIERGKRELVEALPAGGTAVLNADDERVTRMADHLAPGVQVVRYGFDVRADVSATDVESLGAAGMRFVLRSDAGSRTAIIPTLGRHSVHNALAATAVAMTAGMSLDDIADALRRPLTMPHRTRLIEAGRWTILDDTYNAAPDSMIAALDLLATLPGRHVAVLGEMLELGPESTAAHRRVGAHAAQRADVLLGVGAPAQIYTDAAEAAGMSQDFTHTARDKAVALRGLQHILRPGDVVLLKASNGERFFDLVEELIALSQPETVA
ncbi:MAG TPA: UDP-N-acetylmuramoyl-tripeptide--D-alanyl-D-alanine ligase [Candidatus Limnocylindrales bacterium]